MNQRPPPIALLEQRPVLAGNEDVKHPLTNPIIGDPPRKYTLAVHERICLELSNGQRPQGACARAGITVATFYEWIRRGKAGDPHLFQFAEDVEIAFNTAEAKAVDVVAAGFKEGDTANWDPERAQWFLERARADGYSKQVKTAVEGQIRQFLERLEAALEPALFERVLAVYLGQAPAAEVKRLSDTTPPQEPAQE